MTRLEKLLQFINTYKLDGLCPFTPQGEPGFSYEGCDVCSPTLGNDVYFCNLNYANGKSTALYPIQVCHDCLYVAAYGEE